MEVNLIREDENPLFYILSEDIVGIHKLGDKNVHFKMKKGDIHPNFYKKNCHIAEKIGKSKGRLMGLRKEYLGYTTEKNVSVEVLHDIIEKKITCEIL